MPRKSVRAQITQDLVDRIAAAVKAGDGAPLSGLAPETLRGASRIIDTRDRFFEIALDRAEPVFIVRGHSRTDGTRNFNRTIAKLSQMRADDARETARQLLEARAAGRSVDALLADFTARRTGVYAPRPAVEGEFTFAEAVAYWLSVKEAAWIKSGKHEPGRELSKTLGNYRSKVLNDATRAVIGEDRPISRIRIDDLYEVWKFIGVQGGSDVTAKGVWSHVAMCLRACADEMARLGVRLDPEILDVEICKRKRPTVKITSGKKERDVEEVAPIEQLREN